MGTTIGYLIDSTQAYNSFSFERCPLDLRTGLCGSAVHMILISVSSRQHDLNRFLRIFSFRSLWTLLSISLLESLPFPSCIRVVIGEESKGWKEVMELNAGRWKKCLEEFSGYETVV